MKIAELEKDESVKHWFKILKPKQTTRESLLNSMQDFTDFIHMSPCELLDMVEDEIDRKVKPRNQKIKTYIADYTAYLECELDKEELKKYGVSKRDKKNAPLTIHKKLSAIIGFFKYNDVVLPIQERRYGAKPLEEHKGMPEKEDIRKVLTIADPLERAIILVGCSSGLSVNEITNLKVKDFTKGYNEKDGITVLQLRREKTNKDFVTCLTPEASETVNDYLKYRKRIEKYNRVKRNNQLLKQRVTSDNDFLFIGRTISDEYLTTHDDNLRQLTEKAIQEMYRKLAAESGLSQNKQKGIWNFFRSHKMRTWFNNHVRKAGCDQEIKEFLMGHELEGSRNSYFVTNPNEVKQEYLKCISFLTIQKALDVSETLEYKQKVEQTEELMIENDKLKTETERHKVERSEFIRLQKEIEKLKVEKQDMVEAHLESEFDHIQEQEVDEHYHKEDIQKMQEQIDKQNMLIATLAKSLGVDIDFDKPLTASEKKAMKNTEW